MRAMGAVALAGLLALPGALAAQDAPLANAAMERDRAAVERLLAGGADVNAPQGDGSTALHWAAYHGDVEVARALLEAGARIDAVTRIGAMSPLFMAARHGSAPIVQALLAAGADAREVNGNGTTVLMAAAGAGSAAAVQQLVERGADVNATDTTNGQTALMFAAARNSADAIRVLLARGADPHVRTKVFKLEKVRVDANGDPLTEAAEAAERAADKAEEQAARAGAAEKPAAAPRPGAMPQRPRTDRVLGATVMGGMTALHFAAREGAMEAVRALVEGGADVSLPTGGDQTSPLTEAIINGHLDMAKYLLDRGADPRAANVDGLTPLYATIDIRWRANAWYPQPTIDEAQTNYLAFMTALLDRGANVNARVTRKLWFRKFRYGDDWVDPNGATAFWRAAQANDVAAMRLLAARGADTRLATVHGVTPLMVAAGIGFEYQLTNIVPDSRLAAVKLLVEEMGADVNAKDVLHYTTLHGAAYVGDNPLVLYLVSKGGDPTARARGRLSGTQGAEEVPVGTGDTIADMANGPREKSLLHPDTVTLMERLGSLNSNDCRSTACVNNTKAEKKQ